ncbi:MAG: ATP-binding protein [bacterium]|nr:ATP-binding protein [bacterium]
MLFVDCIDNQHHINYGFTMIRREIEDTVRRYAREYPVVTITGPRQSGKTTLCKMVFPEMPYASLEDPEEREFALNDPRGFLVRFPDGAVLDEIQRAPDLLSYIQGIVDERQRPGHFVVTGSQNFELLQTVSQSLAGRTAIARLLPFSLAEIRKLRPAPLSMDEAIYSGSYPRIFDRKLDPREALAFYFATYVERDLRQLINVRDLSGFEIFMKLCAARCGQLVNLSSLGNDCGVAHNTVKQWLSILEASYIIKLLPPYYRNLGKRLVKTPKMYFIDTGLASYLLGIQKVDHVSAHHLKGALFENLVLSELIKSRFNRGRDDNLYFLRDRKGKEVDILLDYGTSLDLVEVKAGQTISGSFFSGIEYYRRIYAETRNCLLVYGGAKAHVQEGVSVIPWKGLPDLDIETHTPSSDVSFSGEPSRT